MTFKNKVMYTMHFHTAFNILSDISQSQERCQKKGKNTNPTFGMFTQIHPYHMVFKKTHCIGVIKKATISKKDIFFSKSVLIATIMMH